MPYAAEGQISTDPIEGGIEITDEQYAEAIGAVIAGKLIKIENGQMVIVDPSDGGETDPISDNITSAPNDLFGGPTLGAIYNGN
ncbi:hypothetical protein [Rhizobium leguminosarum]|uniref:hypothetical protein n=1 Tax=Rhizobium leguminosarum TaxID=384 RepID=UPI003F9CDC00